MVTLGRKRGRTSTFGVRLREIREEKRLTQQALATLVDMPYQNIARYETGTVEPTWPYVVALAEALGVSTEAFKSEDITDAPSDEPADPPPPRRRRK